MIPLITILYAFLFPINEVTRPDCEGKLKELDFAYEYDKEPAICQDDLCRTLGKCHNGVAANTVHEVESMYRCFKEIETNQADKIILISHRSLLDTIHMKGSTKDKALLLDRRENKILYYYELWDNNVFLRSDTTQIKEVKIELLSKNSKKIQDVINQKRIPKIYHDCIGCPF